jgi:hypothetical protein
MEGTRLRQPRGPQCYWIPADADDADAAEARQRLQESRPQPQHYPPPTPPKPRVRCIRTFWDMHEEIREGDEFDFDSPIVASVPENFEPVGE